MRLELLIMLWVGALVVAGLAVSHQPELETPQEAPQVGVGLGAMLVSLEALESTEGVRMPAPAPPRRPLFRVATSLTDPSSIPDPAPPAGLPVLKGIIATADGWRAVFATTPEGSDYQVIAAGESLGAIRIEGVASEIVIARDGTGAVVRFMLRGSGESQQ